MDTDKRELNVHKIGCRIKDENNDNKFRTKGTNVNDTMQSNMCVIYSCSWI